MIWTSRAAVTCLFALVFGLAIARAQTTGNEPIEITADTAEYDDANHTVTYRGNVAVVQGATTIHCSHLTLRQPEGGPQVIVAEGDPVRFHQAAQEGRQEMRGESSRAEYDLDRRQLTLIGNAELVQAGDRVSSDRILYDVATSIVTAGAAAKGTERVRTVIQPRQ